jgi:hypothetical protein
MSLYNLFQMTLNVGYTHVENSGDYAIMHDGEILYIFLECSHGNEDWKNNLDFPVKFKLRDDDIHFRCHRGFLRVWKSMEPYLTRLILDPSVRRIVTVGYSHGAALAVLCHEYVYFHRPDLRTSMEGYGFGCPRVIWGLRSRALTERWCRFTVIRNLDDLVTHLPPALFGYFHVGTRLEIGERGRYSPIDAHRPESILAELRRMEGHSSQLKIEQPPPTHIQKQTGVETAR